MLNGARLVVSRVLVAGVAVNVICDVTAERRGSGLERRGWGVCRGVVGRAGSECRRFRGAGDCLEGGDGAVVAVVGSVDSTDGGCATIVSDDVAHNGGDGGLGTVSSRGAVCVTASMEVVEGWGTVPVDIPASLSGRGSSSQSAVWVTASAVEVGVICITTSAVGLAVWVLESAVSCVGCAPACTALQ